MNADANSPRIPKPEISRFAFAMFDVLGFSGWITSVGLQTVLDSYHSLIERAVVKSNEKGGLSAVRTPEGALFAVTGPPSYAYFSDTILLWCPLVPPLVDDFVGRCSSLICEALAMNIPLRGALTLGDAVLDRKSNFFLGKPIVEAAKLEKAQNWLGLTFGHSAVWSSFLAQLHGRRSSSIHHQRKTASKSVRRRLSWTGLAAGGTSTVNVLQRNCVNLTMIQSFRATGRIQSSLPSFL